MTVAIWAVNLMGFYDEVTTMFALYVDHAGTDVNRRFEVVRILIGEYRMPLADAKMLLGGVRVRLMAGKVSEMQAIQRRRAASSRA